MIELRQSPKGLWFQYDPDNPFVRFKKPDPKSTTPPALPPAAQQISEIIPASAKAGEKAGRRLRRRTGRASTRVTAGALAPAKVTAPGLFTNLAGVTA